MDKQIWSNKCTGHLSSSFALWRGGTHTGQTNDSLPPPDKLQHKKWISSQGLDYFAILATYSPREKILS